MLHKITRALVYLLAFGVSISCAAANRVNDSLFNQLNLVLANKESYVALKEARIKKLEARFRHSPGAAGRYEICRALYNEYKSFRNDSAYAYSKKLETIALHLKDPQKLAISRMSVGFTLLSAGMFKETADNLSLINAAVLDTAERIDYYFLKARCYFDWGDFNRNSDYGKIYYPKALLYLDSALALSKPGGYHYLAMTGLKDMRTERYGESAQNYEALLKLPGLTPNQFAVSASSLSYAYSMQGREEQAIALLVAAAIADIRSATKETVAIYQLANKLYISGDHNNAFNYINEAMEEATFYGARHRQVAISSIMPIIEAQRIATVEMQWRSMFIYASIITVLVLFVIVFAFIIFRQLKKLRIADDIIRKANISLQASNEALGELNKKLSTANKIKNEYIGYYFNINSIYIDKLESFKTSIAKKLASKRYEDAMVAVNNLHLDAERRELYHTFDKVFLRLFPDFIEKFNALFEPKDRAVIPKDELLNSELRIFALIRMGIHDNERISKILAYSVNTIYAYKNRVKTRSVVNNEEFENHIMAIDAV